MASGASVIGQGTRIRGRITGSHDLEVQGHIEGELTMAGDVRVDASATIAADVHARRVVVRGAIKGDVIADEAITLEEGARVVGDLRAPRVAIAPGGLVRGYVETGHAGEGHKTKKAQPAAVARHAPAAAKVHAPAPKPVHAKTVAAKPAATKRGGITLAGGKAPPPVVPVLKKGTKAALTKKR
jgi:cytoskeletal protein CcmA (bactofilin family)